MSMIRKLVALTVLLSIFGTVSIADTSTTGGSRVIENPTQDGNLVMRVNDGGVRKDALTVQGSTTDVTLTGKLFFADGTSSSTWASGAGELNVIANTNDANAGWASTGAGVTVVTTTTPTDLPLGGITPTAIKITPVSGTTDYAYYCWTQPAALKNRKLKASQEQRPLSGYASGDLKLDIYTYATASCGGAATRVVLSTDVSSVTGIPNANGRFTTTFDADGSDYYGIRYTRVAGTTALNIASVIVGPGVTPQGYAGGYIGSFATATGALTTNVLAQGADYWRKGDRVYVTAGLEFSGANTQGIVTVAMPPNLTVDATKLFDGYVGAVGDWLTVGGWSMRDDSALEGYNGSVVYDVSGNQFLLTVDAANGLDGVVRTDTSIPIVIADDDSISWWFEVPVNEWSGSDIVNIGENVPAFACNDGATTVFDTDGCLIPTITALNDNTTTDYTITLPNDLPEEYTPQIQVLSNNSLIWHPVGQSGGSYTDLTLMYTAAGATRRYYGIGVSRISSVKNQFNVRFGNAGATISQTFVNSVSYPAVAGDRYRVAFTRKGEAVGFGLATSTSSGLVKPYSTEGVVYSGVYTPTFSLSLATGGTAQEHRFTRVGSVVTVTGAITGVTVTTTGTNVSATISLPVPTANFVGSYQAGGVGYAYRNANDNKEPMYVESTNGTQTVLIALDATTIPSSGSNTNFYYSFQYEIQ